MSVFLFLQSWPTEADMLMSWAEGGFIFNLSVISICYSTPGLHSISHQAPTRNHPQFHLHLFPTPLLPSLPSPWRRSWRAAWPPWTGFLSWPCRQPSARRTPRMPTGQAWARRVPCWILTPHWTRRRCSSTRTASHPTATPASSRLPSTARQRRRWHWVRSTSGSVITFPTTGRRAVAGRWEKDTSGLYFRLMQQAQSLLPSWWWQSCTNVQVGRLT